MAFIDTFLADRNIDIFILYSKNEITPLEV